MTKEKQKAIELVHEFMHLGDIKKAKEHATFSLSSLINENMSFLTLITIHGDARILLPIKDRIKDLRLVAKEIENL